MRKLILIVTAFYVATATPVAAANDHLEPPESVFGDGGFLFDYYSMVVSAFKAAYSRNVLARVIGIPSFAPEYALGITKSGDTYSVFCLRPVKHFWLYTVLKSLKDGSVVAMSNDGARQNREEIEKLEAYLPPNFRDVKVERRDAPLESALAVHVLELWEVMLRGIRYPAEGALGADGETFHFSMNVNYQLLEGKTWSPSIQSGPGKLVAVVRTMYALCEGETLSTAELGERVREALAHAKQ